MKVLITNTGSWGTGSGAVIDGVTHELVGLNHQVKVFFPDLDVAQTPERQQYYSNTSRYFILRFPIRFKNVSLPTYPLMIPDPNPRNVAKAWTYKDMPKPVFQTYRELLKDHIQDLVTAFCPDVIESHHIWLTGEILSTLNVPFVCCAHNSDQIGFKYDTRMRPYAKRCAQAASYIFALSEKNQNDIINLYDVDPEKVVVIPNGYDHSVFRPFQVSRSELFAQKQLNLPLHLPIVILGSKVSRTKGVHVLLEANKTIQKTVPCLIFLFGTGTLESVLGRPPSHEETKNIVLMHHVSPSVLAQFYNIAHCAVLPSLQEGFPVAALEAMGCGLPVIATDTCNLGSHMVGKEIPAGDAPRLAEAIKEVLTLSNREYTVLKTEAHQKATQYTWRQNTEKRLEYYKKSITTQSRINR